MTAYAITATVIGVVFCAMAIWPSLFPRITPTQTEPTEEQP
ncbi:hypothetical protein ACFQ6Q_04305 [Streptomyces sp. NPDC056437]